MSGTPPPTQRTLASFGLQAIPQPLPGGSTRTYRVGDTVMKHIKDTSLENNHSPELAAWIAEFSAEITMDGFRLPRGIPTHDGRWITPSGWTAWTFQEGNPATADDIPQCIASIERLHYAIRTVPRHPLLDESHTPWTKAQVWCLGEQPAYVHPLLGALVDRLYELRKPVPTQGFQVIHGDLNPDNVIVAPGLPPAFIDFSPFWGPPELALAIFANWIGPRRGNAQVLDHFRHLPNFDQWLIRAGIRMLLVMSEHRAWEGDWDTSPEKEAARIILDFARP